MNYFEFNGHKSTEYGLIVNGINILNAPSRIVDKINIPYRNGDLLIDTGVYSNIMVSYTIGLTDPTKARNIADWLLNTSGYKTLKDTYDTTEYRMASYYNDLNYQMSMLYRYGEATISFDCKPQRYLVSGDTATSTFPLSNPTNYNAQPIIVIGGNGTCTVNGYSITVADNASNTLTIDCERMQCYRGTTNMNASVTLANGFPFLSAGSNTVSVGTVTSVSITPRWWRL